MTIWGVCPRLPADRSFRVPLVFSLTALPWFRRWFGTRAERSAAKHLASLGYCVLARNWTCPHGEIDLVALDGQTIVFVEVRSTEGHDPLVPAASVDRDKQRRLTKLALAYLQAKNLLDRAARFDVVAVSWPAGKAKPTMVHYPGAFEATDRYQFFS